MTWCVVFSRDRVASCVLRLVRVLARGGYPGARRRLHFVHDFVGQLHGAIRDVDARLGDEIHGAQLERPHGGFAAFLGQRGDHDHRQRMSAHQFLKKGQPIHLGHFYIQRDHVRLQAEDFLAGDERVHGRSHHFDRRIA